MVLVQDFDVNQDGFIPPDDLKMCVNSLKGHDPNFPEVSFDDLLRRADENGDGKISTEELAKWIKRIPTGTT